MDALPPSFCSSTRIFHAPPPRHAPSLPHPYPVLPLPILSPTRSPAPPLPVLKAAPQEMLCTPSILNSGRESPFLRLSERLNGFQAKSISSRVYPSENSTNQDVKTKSMAFAH